MSSSKTKTETHDDDPSARFEYRVWGEHRKARKLIRKLADSETREEVDDWYLLIHDESVNAKIRDNTLKIKQLVATHKGFERWVSDKPDSSEATPSPFDSLYDALDLDGPPSQDPGGDVIEAVDGLGEDSDVRAVNVTKRRKRYRIGDLRAEVTDIHITETGDVVRTLCIEGDNLRDLVKLRKALGLKGETNTSVSQYIELELDS